MQRRTLTVVATGVAVLGSGLLAAALAHGLISEDVRTSSVAPAVMEKDSEIGARGSNRPSRHVLPINQGEAWGREGDTGDDQATPGQARPELGNGASSGLLGFGSSIDGVTSQSSGQGHGFSLNAPAVPMPFSSDVLEEAPLLQLELAWVVAARAQRAAGEAPPPAQTRRRKVRTLAEAWAPALVRGLTGARALAPMGRVIASKPPLSPILAPMIPVIKPMVERMRAEKAMPRTIRRMTPILKRAPILTPGPIPVQISGSPFQHCRPCRHIQATPAMRMPPRP